MDSKKGLYALSCIEDVVVVRAHIMNREIPIDDNGLATIFLSKAFALTESGAPPTQGFGTPTLEVPASDIPGLNELFPPAGGHVFTFRKVPISPKERPLADALIPGNHSAYTLETITLG